MLAEVSHADIDLSNNASWYIRKQHILECYPFRDIIYTNDLQNNICMFKVYWNELKDGRNLICYKINYLKYNTRQLWNVLDMKH